MGREKLKNKTIEFRENAKNLTVLYAEDDEAIRGEIEQFLSRFFKKVLIAQNGEEAIGLFQKIEIDLILTDINMPKINGVDFIKNIKSLDRDIPPVVVLTAYGEYSQLIELINLNVDGFLMKPILTKNLLQILNKICSNIQNQVLLKNTLSRLSKQNRVLKTKLDLLAKEKNIKESSKKIEKRVEIDESEKVEKERTYIEHYKSLLREDVEELKELSSETDSFINMLFNKDKVIDRAYLPKIVDVYRKYARVFNSYYIFSDIGVELVELANTIVNGFDIIEKSQKSDIAILMESLHFSFEHFILNVWEHKSKEPTFYNKSIISDIKTVKNFFENRDVEDKIEFF